MLSLVANMIRSDQYFEENRLIAIAPKLTQALCITITVFTLTITFSSSILCQMALVAHAQK